MCGIAGLWAPELSSHTRREHVERMLGCLVHRGPDGDALWNGPGITLGLARLAIVAPHLPARTAENETATVHAVVNGEIYNHRELHRGLRSRGHRIAAGPDTTVIPHLYEQHGPRFPEVMDGMFAVALWDARDRRLVLARDRAGEKPLFYTADGSNFAFASEPKALLGLPWVSRAPAPGALARYLAHGFFAGGDSAFAALHTLPPGHVLQVTETESRLTRYWRPWDRLPADGHHVAAPSDDATILATTREHLERAVHSRVPDEVPFGVFLSGGVDSGVAAALVARHHRRFPTFSLGWTDQGYDESALARTVADLLGAQHFLVTMDHRSGEEALSSYAETMDEPLGDPSLLPTWALARLAAKHVPVVLTGEGGDELFGGYPTYLGHRYAGLAEHMPAALASALVALARRVRPGHHHVTVPLLIERFLGTRGLAPFERHLAWFGTAQPAEAEALLAPDLRAALEPDAARGHLRAFAAAIGDRCGATARRPDTLAYQLLDFELYLGGGLLTKVDRCTMAHGVESRAPFLSAPLIEHAFALPESARLRGRTGKWALKQIARELLPEAIVSRRKQGFSPPFSAWARGPLRGMITAKLARARIERAGVLDAGAVERMLAQHLSGAAERGRTLWAVLSLQMWAERWCASAAHRPTAGLATTKATATVDAATSTAI